MTSIPANRIVNVTPTVIPVGGTGLDVQGLFLTASNRVPIGAVRLFPNSDAVSAFFGASSTEYAVSLRYFAGYDGSPIKPAGLLFSQYNAGAVAAYLRGGNVSALTLAQLQAISGTVTLTVNGVAATSSAINLSSATSFSSAAALIAAAFNYSDVAFTGAIAGNVLTVTAVANGTLAVGQVVTGAGVTAGTTITAFGTATGGTGTYTVSGSQNVSSESMTAGALTVAYDSVSGAFVLTGGTPGVNGTITPATTSAASTALKLTTATGATPSQGAAAATPASAMTAVTNATQDFVTFATIFQPSTNDMVAFGAWTDAQGARYAYIQTDSNAAMTVLGDVSSAAALIAAAGYGGTCSIYSPSQGPFKAAFVMGAVASIDFSRVNGRVNIALLSQLGLSADITDASIADVLKANAYNYYGAFATANAPFLLFYEGAVSGPYAWLDSYINAVWMANNFQLALMTLLTTTHNIPYNQAGYALIDAALIGVIDAAVSFGAIRAGVPLSAFEAAEVNAQAGVAIDGVLTQRGWYLQILPASAQVRAARGSPPITFWYTDGQSVQQINLNSAEVQ